MSAIEKATINELIIEYHRITRQLLCTHQDDATACYERIVMNNTITSSRKYLIPDNTCKVNNLAQKKLYTKPNHKVTHQNIVTLIRMNYHFIVGGGGQGSGNRKSLWSFISILLMEVKDKIVPGCTINPPSSYKIWKLKMLGFVDKKETLC